MKFTADELTHGALPCLAQEMRAFRVLCTGDHDAGARMCHHGNCGHAQCPRHDSDPVPPRPVRPRTLQIGATTLSRRHGRGLIHVQQQCAYRCAKSRATGAAGALCVFGQGETRACPASVCAAEVCRNLLTGTMVCTRYYVTTTLHTSCYVTVQLQL